MVAFTETQLISAIQLSLLSKYIVWYSLSLPHVLVFSPHVFCMQREDSPVKAEIEQLLAEGNRQGSHTGDSESEDNDIIVDEYVSDEEQSKHEDL